MVVASTVAVILVVFVEDQAVAFGVLDGFTVKLLFSVGCTTIVWLLATFLRLTHPGGPGWSKVVKEAVADGDAIDEKDRGRAWEMPIQILCVFAGCVVIYSLLFSIGSFVYGNLPVGFVLAAVSVGGTVFLFKSFSKLRAD